MEDLEVKERRLKALATLAVNAGFCERDIDARCIESLDSFFKIIVEECATMVEVAGRGTSDASDYAGFKSSANILRSFKDNLGR